MVDAGDGNNPGEHWDIVAWLVGNSVTAYLTNAVSPSQPSDRQWIDLSGSWPKLPAGGLRW